MNVRFTPIWGCDTLTLNLMAVGGFALRALYPGDQKERTVDAETSRTYAKEWQVIARMNVALMRLSHASYFPRTVSVSEALLLRVILQHVILWEIQSRPATVSGLARVMGTSRATARRRLNELVAYGYIVQIGRHYLQGEGMARLQRQQRLFQRYSAVITQTCKELEHLGH